MADYDTNIERKWKMRKHIVNTFSHNKISFSKLIPQPILLFSWTIFVHSFVFAFFNICVEIHWTNKWEKSKKLDFFFKRISMQNKKKTTTTFLEENQKIDWFSLKIMNLFQNFEAHQ